jgi:cytoskeletal protein RodZ
MFTPWIRRKSLKRQSKGKRLVVEGQPLSLVSLLVLLGVVILFGLFVVQLSRAFSGN